MARVPMRHKPQHKNNWLLHIKTDLSNVHSSNTIVLIIANATEGACSCSLRAALLSIVFKACKIVSNSYLNANNVTKCACAHCTSNLLVFNWARTWIARAKFEVPHMTSCNWVILYYLTSFQPSTYICFQTDLQWGNMQSGACFSSSYFWMTTHSPATLSSLKCYATNRILPHLRLHKELALPNFELHCNHIGACYYHFPRVFPN